MCSLTTASSTCARCNSANNAANGMRGRSSMNRSRPASRMRCHSAAGSGAITGHVNRALAMALAQALARRATAARANGCRRFRPHARFRSARSAGGAGAGPASKPFGITKFIAAGACGKLSSNQSRMLGVFNTRAALRRTRRALDATRKPLRDPAAVPFRPVVGAPRIAVVEDQRPLQSPRHARAGDERRVRRRGGDDDAAR